MFSSPSVKGSGGGRDSGNVGTDFSLRSDYYEGDFVEDGSFLVLNTDGLSLSPSTPPEEKSDDEEERNLDIEVLNGDGEVETSMPSGSEQKVAEAQVLGEDPESSVESGNSLSKVESSQKTGSLSSGNQETVTSSMTGMSVASCSSVSTDTHLIESGEEVSILMAENKKLADLLADSNEKMKQCITTTEKLKADHEEYKKKHEASREIINQLRHDNEVLKSQVSVIQSTRDLSETSKAMEKELATKHEALERHAHTISELNERLQTVLTFNGQLNDDLQGRQKVIEELRTELEKMHAENAESAKKFDVMKAEIDTGRQTISKFNEHRMRNEAELSALRAELHTAAEKTQRLEAIVEEKTKLTESLRRNMEDTVMALERVNQKLNQKEDEVSILTTKIAALSAESENHERVQMLEMQCQTYLSDFEKEREERAKLAAEKEALLSQLNLVTQELREKSDALNRLNGQQSGDYESTLSGSRNDNSAANSNESLPSPLTSLPSVGQFVGFVRRELLGWEDQSGAAASADTGVGEDSGSSEAVVQQPKQESIPPCPICRKVFPTLDKLQTHAANCGIENFGDRSDPFVFP